MSIEKNLERIATALEQLAGAKPTVEAAPAPAVTVETWSEALPEEPAIKPKKAPVVEAPTSNLPFNDAKSLSAYVMTKYKTLGPIKGALIQNVLAELGLKNISDIKAEQYEAFHAKVEAL